VSSEPAAGQTARSDTQHLEIFLQDGVVYLDQHQWSKPDDRTVTTLEGFLHLAGRTRRIAIVALARKLLIALWRYVEAGVVPAGVEIRTETVVAA
jgi:hypothetical protein